MLNELHEFFLMEKKDGERERGGEGQKEAVQLLDFDSQLPFGNFLF